MAVGVTSHRATHDPDASRRARAREAQVEAADKARVRERQQAAADRAYAAVYGEKPLTPPSGLGRPTLADTRLPAARRDSPTTAPQPSGHRPPRQPQPPGRIELAEALGQTCGTVIALQAQLRGRVVECDRWAHHLEREQNPATAKEYAAEAQGLRWGLAAIDRVLAALNGEKRPDRLALPDALPGVLPDGV